MLFELFLAHYLFFSFQTCIQRYRSEKYQQPSEIKTSVNVSVKQTAKNCQLELGQLFNTVFFLAKGGLSFRKYCKLCSLQSKNDIVLAKILLLIWHVADLFHLSASLEKITLENPSTNTFFFGTVRRFNWFWSHRARSNTCTIFRKWLSLDQIWWNKTSN